MHTLAEDLQLKKKSLSEFYLLADRLLKYFPEVFSSYEVKNHYRLYISEIASTRKHIRPINTRLFFSDVAEFEDSYQKLLKSLSELKEGKRDFSLEEKLNIDRSLYTIQQAVGAGLDLLVNPNSARKHTGNRFEELIKAVFTELNIANQRKVLKIPYETEDGIKYYTCENDLILSPDADVKTNAQSLDEREIVVGVKTTSKDRMGKMFIDKMLLERFVGHKQKVIGVFLNDVQRKETKNISYTLVSGFFMVYTRFLVQLEGIYYLDPPPNALKSPYDQHMKCFSDLITEDIWELFAS